MNILDLSVLTLGLQWWSTKAGNAWWLPQMKSGETQSSQAEIIRSVVKQNPKQHAGCDSPKPEVIWTVVKLNYKDSCQGWRCWRSRSVGWRQQSLVDKSFNWLCSPLCSRWSWRSYSWFLCWQSCTTRVSAFIYCFMKWGTIMAQYTLNFYHYDFVSAELVH